LIVHFQNGEKNMLMQIQVASDAVRFYDSFYHYNSGETIMLRFLPNDRVAVGGFLFNIISMKEYQEPALKEKQSQPATVTRTF